MVDNLKEIKYRNSKAYLKAINKVKPCLLYTSDAADE